MQIHKFSVIFQESEIQIPKTKKIGPQEQNPDSSDWQV